MYGQQSRHTWEILGSNGNKMENILDVIKFARNSLLYCEDKPLMIVDRAP